MRYLLAAMIPSRFLGGANVLLRVTNCRLGCRVTIERRSLADGEEFMTFHLDIPESVAQSLRLPAPEVVPRLRTELAVALYARGILSFGKASEFAEVSRFAFADLIAQHDIPRHYTEGELTQDLDYR
jgi:hypothetical protein